MTLPAVVKSPAVVMLLAVSTGLLLLVNWGAEVVLACDAGPVDVGDAEVPKVTLLLLYLVLLDKRVVSSVACIVVSATLLISRCVPGSVFVLFLGSLVALGRKTESDVE
jgi:hypothetical protein